MRNIFEGYDPYEDRQAIDLFVDQECNDYNLWLQETRRADHFVSRYVYCKERTINFEQYAQALQDEVGCE